MAHHQQFEFIDAVKAVLPEFFRGRRVLEVGSLDINGSIRSAFEACDYTGADLSPGPGVDIACPGQLLEFPTGHFDVALSCECFEHNPYWVETWANMLRMTRPGGLVLMSCATTGRREHGTTRSAPDSSPFTVKHGWNYYRNLTRADVESRFDLGEWFSDHGFVVSAESFDLYFVGIRKDGPPLPAALLPDLRRRFSATRSLKALKRRLKMLVLGNVLSSPLNAYFKGRR
ncbi:MAG: class I SAM-dependent methyltransferase [Burkholderiales bacterium]|nr:class I SAM-dependent methyltransferase [Burkholderiales bacterium]